MAPRGPGGRPKKEWTAARRRQLVRLYALTTLNNEEIRNVLRSDGFCPKERNIQTQLQSLFPKEYRRFRPRNDAQMGARLLPIRRICAGRIAKSKAPLKPKISEKACDREGSTVPLIVSGKPGIDIKNTHGSDTFKIHYTSKNSTTSPNSSLPTISSRLMLDGSITQSVSPPATNGAFQIQEPDVPSRRSQTGPPFPQPHIESSHCNANIVTLGEQLPNRSPSFVHRMLSVLSHSTLSSSRSTLSRSTNSSWRSTWMSVDTLESNNSDKPSDRPPNDGSNSTFSSLERLPTIHVRPSKKAERKFWGAVIDDSNMLPSSKKPRPAYSQISLQQRPCCVLLPSGDGVCHDCGWSRAHFAWTSGINKQELEQCDYFGNTHLYFIASSSNPCLNTIMKMIDGGANALATNTTGQTFMHVLNNEAFISLEQTSGYIALLRRLQSLDFPFSLRDCHGRTLAHTLTSDTFTCLANNMSRGSSAFSEIFSILDIDLNALDNYGEDAGYRLEDWHKRLLTSAESTYSKLNEEIQGILTKHRRKFTMNSLNFRESLSYNKEDSSKERELAKLTKWIEGLKTAGLASWVDVHGDTPLIAFLKEWRHSDSEIEDFGLVKGVLGLLDGADMVDMRDRKGLTALAVAAIRGSEPAVKLLLSSGANFNSKNYRGKGIISQASRRMALAKGKGDSKCYARILTCINLLTDSGAKVKPTERDEWLLPALRGKVDVVS